jgi:hypothetical protein
MSMLENRRRKIQRARKRERESVKGRVVLRIKVGKTDKEKKKDE